MIEAVSTSVTTEYFNETTRRNNPESCHLQAASSAAVQEIPAFYTVKSRSAKLDREKHISERQQKVMNTWTVHYRDFIN
jgi:hypothetical protein